MNYVYLFIIYKLWVTGCDVAISDSQQRFIHFSLFAYMTLFSFHHLLYTFYVLNKFCLSVTKLSLQLFHIILSRKVWNKCYLSVTKLSLLLLNLLTGGLLLFLTRNHNLFFISIFNRVSFFPYVFSLRFATMFISHYTSSFLSL